MALSIFKLDHTSTSCKKLKNFYEWFRTKTPDKYGQTNEGSNGQTDVGEIRGFQMDKQTNEQADKRAEGVSLEFGFMVPKM